MGSLFRIFSEESGTCPHSPRADGRSDEAAYSLTRRSQSRCRVMFPDKTRRRRLLPRLQTKSKLSLPSL